MYLVAGITTRTATRGLIQTILAKLALLADTVTLDAAGKITAVGIFGIIFARRFPAVHRDMTLVANL